MIRCLLAVNDVDSSGISPLLLRFRTKASLSVCRTESSSMLAGAFEYARIVRDLHSNSTPLSIITHSTLDNPFEGWKVSVSSLQAQIREQIDSASHLSDSGSRALSSEPITKLLVKSVNLLSRTDGSDPKLTKGISGRLVLFCSQPTSQIGDLWLYTEEDGTQLSIPDFIDNLVSENNHKAATDPQITLIDRLELSILVFVPEKPVSNHQQDSADPNSQVKSGNVGDGAFKGDSKLHGDSMEISSPGSPSHHDDLKGLKGDGIYYQDPSCFSDGAPIPPSKLISDGLNIVTADLNFIRPSFAHQAISDLLASHYQLEQLNILGMPLKERNTNVFDSRVVPIPLLISNPSLHTVKTYPQGDSTRFSSHIGSQLGTGLIPTRNLFWKAWDPQLSIHGLPCNRIARVSPLHPGHVASLSLLGSVLEGRPILLSTQIPLVDGDEEAPPGVILMRHGNYIYAHELRERDDVSVLRLDGLDVESQFGQSALTPRFDALRNLIESNTFLWTRYNTEKEADSSGMKSPLRPNSNVLVESVPLGPLGRSEDFSKRKQAVSENGWGNNAYLTTKALDSWTRIFPLFEQDTVCFQSGMNETLQRYVIPILLLISRFELPEEVIPHIKVQIEELAQMAVNNDPLLFGATTTKGSVAKRRELYSQLWRELLTIAKAYQAQSPVHAVVAALLKSSAPDPSLASKIFANQALSSTHLATPSNAMEVDDKASITHSAPPPASSDSSTSAPTFSSERDDESRWLNDVSNARHDIVGLKDLSWAGGRMESSSSSSRPTPSIPSGSLYQLYWQGQVQSKPQ